MKPKWQPIAFPRECAPYGQSPLQPLMVKENAVVVAGGPSALFLVKVTHVPYLLQTIEARVHISGFAAHGDEVYVQDGPVLSGWSLKTGRPIAAINLLDPSRRWAEGRGEPDWAWLHTLPEQERGKQDALRRARRVLEWVQLLEAAEAALTRRRVPDYLVDDDADPLGEMVADLRELAGARRDGARSELAECARAAAGLIFSPPVVRSEQVGAKGSALVFALGSDGTLHPLDSTLTTMRTARLDRAVRPSLAMAELETDAHGDEHACRLFYVTDDGTVRLIDGDALPPKSLAEWPGRGPVSAEPGVRPRLDSGLLWGSAAQGSGIFALPFDPPGGASRVTLPLDGGWQWLELRTNFKLALASGGGGARLMAYGAGVTIVDRWPERPPRAPYFATFLPEPEEGPRPLLVVEVDREARSTGVAYRLLVANTVDSPYRSGFFPPPPAVLVEGVLEGWGQRAAPALVRTQPSVSRFDAYVVARDRTGRQQIAALPDSWPEYRNAIMREYGGLPQARAALGELALPPLDGTDALYCYPLVNSLTSHDVERANQVVQELRDLANPVRLSIYFQHLRYNKWDQVIQDERQPYLLMMRLRNTTVTLRFGGGGQVTTRTDDDGWVYLRPETAGERVVMDPVVEPNFEVQATECVLTRTGENVLKQRVKVRIP
jgi:hypothetical protein